MKLWLVKVQFKTGVTAEYRFYARRASAVARLLAEELTGTPNQRIVAVRFHTIEDLTGGSA